jgi:subtilisin family serine protease
MKYILCILVFITLCLPSCKTHNSYQTIKTPNSIRQRSAQIDSKNWHLQDIELDTVPGISLQRAYDSLLVNKKRKEVIVAVIDSEIDTDHNDLKSRLWLNKDEIPNNGLDDDNNGYIDDIHGWNFLGNKQGDNNKYVNFESTRILKRLTPYFELKNLNNLSSEDSIKYTYYQKVLKRQESLIDEYTKDKVNSDNLYNFYFDIKNKVSAVFDNKAFNRKDLDSLKQVENKNIDQDDLLDLIELLDYNVNDDTVIRQKTHFDNIISRLLSLNYNDRKIQNDNENDITDIDYGNNMGYTDDVLDHGTNMSGIIAGIALNKEVKIMSLATSAYGDENDKDIALSIRYAVDNGAKVINMSFWKEFSIYEDWVLNAIKYAERNDVLIISIAGNDGLNLNQNLKYPNDKLTDGTEVSDNFILAGASNHTLNKEFMLAYSNYGTIDVDLFAPGNKIYTTSPNNKYKDNSGGTSSAGAITSGVAALIRSYYPGLTASQVKRILMDSGIEYTLEVSTPTEENPEKTTPFNQLSKSGKVVNAYNALIMAERISRAQ